MTDHRDEGGIGGMFNDVTGDNDDAADAEGGGDASTAGDESGAAGAASNAEGSVEDHAADGEDGAAEAPRTERWVRLALHCPADVKQEMQGGEWDFIDDIRAAHPATRSMLRTDLQHAMAEFLRDNPGVVADRAEELYGDAGVAEGAREGRSKSDEWARVVLRCPPETKAAVMDRSGWDLIDEIRAERPEMRGMDGIDLQHAMVEVLRAHPAAVAEYAEQLYGDRDGHGGDAGDAGDGGGGERR